MATTYLSRAAWLRAVACAGLLILDWNRAGLAQSNYGNQNQTAVSDPANPGATWQFAPIDATSSLWQGIVPSTDANGLPTNTPSSFVEVASGLNFLDTNGAWQRSQDLIELTQDGGAAAVHAGLKITFAPNPSGSNPITITTPQNRVFHTGILGVSYWDGVRSAPIASAQSSVGQILPPNQILFTNAFSGIDADLRITVTKAGYEVDVLILTQLPAPETVAMSSDSTRVQIWHSFDAPSQPNIQTNQLLTGLVDQTLDFGDLWFPAGRAFAFDSSTLSETNTAAEIQLGNTTDPGQIPTSKQWLGTTNGNYLVEEVNWRDLAQKLAGLPLVADASSGSTRLRRSSLGMRPPVPKPGRQPAEPIRLASGPYKARGFDWDYITVSGSGSYAFSSNTYYLSSGGYFSGALSFAPNAILKFPKNKYLLGYGTFAFNGTATAPTVFTSKDDGLYGQEIFGSTGQPTNAASQALWAYYPGSNVNVSNALIRWSQTGVQFDENTGTGLTHSFNNSIIELSTTGIAADNCTVNLKGSTYCSVTTPTSNLGSATFSGTLTNVCSGNVDGIPDSWLIYYFGTTNLSPFSDPDGDAHGGVWNTLLYDYTNGVSPVKTMIAEWGADAGSMSTIPYGLGNAKMVCGGNDFSLALGTNGIVYAWGTPFYPDPTNLPPSVTTNGANVRAIAACVEQCGAVLPDGSVITWGKTNQTGLPPTLTNAASLAMAYQHGIALLSSG
jgi:hypothetical protein